MELKYIGLQPFNSTIDISKEYPQGQVMDCAIFQSDNPQMCEFAGDDKYTACDISGIYYGTSDGREPKFCARHFYQDVVCGDGISNYKLVEIKHVAMPCQFENCKNEATRWYTKDDGEDFYFCLDGEHFGDEDPEKVNGKEVAVYSCDTQCPECNQ